jgi:hypothetical protein
MHDDGPKAKAENPEEMTQIDHYEHQQKGRPERGGLFADVSCRCES